MRHACRGARGRTTGWGRLGRWLITGLLLHASLQVPMHAGAQPNTGPTIALIDQRLSALRAGDAGPATAETIQNYDSARESFVRAESFAQTASDYIETLTTAPAEEALIRERLDRLGESPDVRSEIAGLSASELQTRLSLARIQLSEASSRLSELDRQLAARESNAAAIRDRLTEIGRLLSNLPVLTPGVDPNALPSLGEAREWRVAAERAELNAERRALEARLSSMPPRYGAISAQRTEQSIDVTRLTTAVRELEARATEIAFTDLRPELLGVDTTDPVYPVAVVLLERDRALRADLENLTEKLTQVRLQLATLQDRARELEEDSSRARRAVEFAAGSDTLGRVLLAYWNDLSSYYVAPPSLRLSREVSDAVLSRIGHETELTGLASIRAYINEALQENQIDATDLDEAVLSGLLDFTRGYRDQLREAIATESDYIQQLTELDVANTSLSNDISDYRSYLESLILWAPTRAVAWEVNMGMIPAEIEATRSSLSSIDLRLSIAAIPALLGFLVLLLARSSLTTRIDALNQAARLEGLGQGRNALMGLMLVILRCAPVPLLLLAFAALITDTGIGTGIGLELADAIQLLALTFLALEVVRTLSAPEGVGIQYLGWSQDSARQAEIELRWITRRWFPVGAVAAFAVLLTSATGDAIISRIAMLCAAGALAFHLVQGIANRSKATSVRWYQGTINACALVALAISAATIVGVLLGRGIGVVVLTSGALTTVYAFTGVLILHGLASGWLQRIQRRLRADATQAADVEKNIDSPTDSHSRDTDWESIESRAQQLINVTVAAISLITVFSIWRPWLAALGSAMEIVLLASETTIDGQLVANELTVGDIVGTVIVFSLTIVAARRLPAFLELVLSGRATVSTGARYAIRTLANYFVIGTGLLTALSLLGFDWAQLRWLVAALGVGIGFGLQEIVANFISGLIILFERPIRVGDIVTIGTHAGQVTKIRIRATTIRDWDGKELLVPNKDLITGQLTNWTLSDTTTRIVIPIGIAYGSDIDKAIELLSDVLSSHPAVMADPPPSVIFSGFGDNSLNLEARCFVADLSARVPTMSELHLQFNRILKEAGIVIAFPQRDVHIDSDRPFRVVLDRGATDSANG